MAKQSISPPAFQIFLWWSVRHQDKGLTSSEAFPTSLLTSAPDVRRLRIEQNSRYYCTVFSWLGVSLPILIYDFYSLQFGSNARHSPFGKGPTFFLLCLYYFPRFTSCLAIVLAIVPSLSSSHGSSLEATTLLGQTSCRQPALSALAAVTVISERNQSYGWDASQLDPPNYSRCGTS